LVKPMDQFDSLIKSGTFLKYLQIQGPIWESLTESGTNLVVYSRKYFRQFIFLTM
jgi:hypothetical protein